MSNQKILFKIKEKLGIIDDESKDGFSLDSQNEMLIEEVLNNNLPTILNTKSIKCYSDFHHLEKACNEIYKTMKMIKDEAELNEFFSGDKNFDTVNLKKKYISMNLKAVFPKFNIDKYLEILNNPITEFKNFNGEVIKFDLFWIKKMLIAINQMIFNEMDIYILNIGKEGSGKSCWSSQQILFFYSLLKLVGLIDYAWEIERMFFTDIQSFLDENSSQKKDDFFRIECLDEGNELNRSNFREDTNQEFKYQMRTERKMLRIIIINVQQIGELDTSISLSRVNFIYDCRMKSNKKIGTLNKGFIDMYVIPRGNEIYSEKYKKIFSRSEILNSFAGKLDKKKDYYIGLPNDLVIKSFKFKNLWGFDKDEYSDHVKDEMQKRKFQKSMKMSDLQAYILMTKVSKFANLGTFDRKNNPNDKKLYDNLYNLFKKINSYFKSNPEKLMAIEKQYSVDKSD